MSNKDSIEILTALANGIDPTTGEVLPNSSPYQTVEVTRALFHAIEQLKKIKPKRPLPVNAGSAWTKEEDDKLREAYNSGRSITDIAKIHRRTSGAIERRLERMGLLSKMGH